MCTPCPLFSRQVTHLPLMLFQAFLCGIFHQSVIFKFQVIESMVLPMPAVCSPAVMVLPLLAVCPRTCLLFAGAGRSALHGGPALHHHSTAALTPAAASSSRRGVQRRT
jgi:hypothetical protein